MYDIKTKLTGDKLIKYFYDAIDEVLKSRRMSEIQRKKINSDVGQLVAAKIAGDKFNIKEPLIFENVDRKQIGRRLTKNQRMELFQLQVLNAAVESFAKEFDANSLLSKEQAKYIKSATSLLDKVIMQITNEMDEEELRKYRNWGRKFRLAFLDGESIIDRDKIKKIDQWGDKYCMSQEEFLDFLEGTIELKCRGCTKENYKECRYYKTMYELDVDYQNLKEGCPYKLEKR